MQAWGFPILPVPVIAGTGDTNLFNFWNNDLSGSIDTPVVFEPCNGVWFLCVCSLIRYESRLVVLRLSCTFCDCRNSSWSTNTILSLPFCWRLRWRCGRFRVDYNDFCWSSIFIEIRLFMRDPICGSYSIGSLNRLGSSTADPVDTTWGSMWSMTLGMPWVMHVRGDRGRWRWVIVLICSSWSSHGLSHCDQRDYDASVIDDIASLFVCFGEWKKLCEGIKNVWSLWVCVCVVPLAMCENVDKSEWQRREDLGIQRVKCDRKSRIIGFQSTRKMLSVLCSPKGVEKIEISSGERWISLEPIYHKGLSPNEERIFYCRERIA